MEISINELFSGIGAQRKALLNLGFDIKMVGISEIDKYAIQSYEAIFGKTRNYGDISKVKHLDYADLWTYSFPCTDISLAGLQKGINENTRSGLLYQVKRLLEQAEKDNILPKYLLLENVKNLVGKRFKPQFDEWINYLDELGYKTYWKVLNAKDYGIPQNRERVFAVSIRKDVNLNFIFPPKIEFKTRLKDLLEDDVDEKFYISQDKINKILCSNFNQEKTMIQESDICQTLLARDYKDPKCVRVKENTKKNFNKVVQVGNITDTTNCSWDNPQRGRIYDSNGISPTLNCMQGGGLEPKIIEDFRIRKLTPKECWRLMGFDDEDFEKAKASGVSNSQLYKQAGNSIVVNVLEEIFTNFIEWD